jgi:hypothetical protein
MRMILKNKNIKKEKKCYSTCDPAREVKRMECLRHPKSQREQNASATRKERTEVK